MVWIGSVMLGTQDWKTLSQKQGTWVPFSGPNNEASTTAVPAPVHRLLLALHVLPLDLGLSLQITTLAKVWWWFFLAFFKMSCSFLLDFWMENLPYVWVKAGSHDQHWVMPSYLLIFHRCTTAYAFPSLIAVQHGTNTYLLLCVAACPFFLQSIPGT